MVLFHRLFEFFLHTIEVDDEVRAGIFDRLGRLLVTRGLALDLNAVFQRVRLAIPCKFYGTIA